MLQSFAGQVYYVEDDNGTKAVPCYGCPAGREPRHVCGQTYTSKEIKGIRKECMFCRENYYKELPFGESNHEKCGPCSPCFGFKVKRACSKTHGAKCHPTECQNQYFLEEGLCKPCCYNKVCIIMV